jgi:A/G-specific adenine glycosylase
MSKREHADAPATAQARALHLRLLPWFSGAKRDLPWRRTRDPYAIWVSEVMLQQTRVETVIPYYARFLARFPTVHALAEAPQGDVLAQWSGLGYYRRARMLHEGAQAIAKASMPRDRDGLLGVRGIGRYTAGAIASIAFGEAVGLVDGNVARVLARLFAIEDDVRAPATVKKLYTLADALVAKDDPSAWNQALMELGATICTPRSPRCAECPAMDLCAAKRAGKENALPVLAKKTPPRAARIQALVATRARKVLLARRAGDGLFGGLWEPPSIEGSARSRKALLAGFALGEVVARGKIEHVLSHRRFTVDVVCGVLVSVPKAAPTGYDAVRLAEPKDLEDLGISTLTRKILRAADVA